MGLFSRKNKVKHLGQVGLDNPMEVVPVVEPGVEARRDDRDWVQIRRAMEPRGRVYGLVARLLKYRHQIRVNLDEMGSFFWRQIDGQKDLLDIAGALAGQYDLSEDKAREATVAFTRNLMMRHLIYLRVPDAEPQAS